MKKNKVLKVLATSAMLASVATPFAAGVASANSSNLVDKVLKVSSNQVLQGDNKLIVKEDDVEFGTTTSDTFRVVLPEGTKWKFPTSGFAGIHDGVTVQNVNTDANGNVTDYELSYGGTIAKVEITTDRVAEVKMTTSNNAGAGALNDEIHFPLFVDVDGATGELKAKVESMDSTVTSGEYTFAIASSGATVTTVDSVETIGQSGKGGQIRIEENSTGVIAPSTHDANGNLVAKQFTLKLPSNFEWKNMTTSSIKAGGGFGGGNFNVTNVSGNGTNTLTVSYTLNTATSGSRGYLYITPEIKANSDAQKGDVTVSVSGSEFADADVVVAKYADWGVDVKVDKVEELVAGKYDEYTKTAKITIEETVPNSLIGGRDIDVKLPSWVKVVDITDWNATNSISKPSVPGDDNEITISVPSSLASNRTSTAKIEFKVQLSVEANKTGDIEATVSGGGIDERKVVIAKAIAPATASVEGEIAKLKIGAQDQEAPTFYITEAKKGVFEKNSEYANNTNGEIVVTLPEGVKFAKAPKVEVVEGDGAIETNNVRRVNDDRAIAIPIKSESIKPMKLKVSDVRLTVDRTVPEGPIQAKIGGTAVVENYVNGGGWTGSTSAASTNMQAGEFNTANAVTFDLATTVTPAPTDTTATNVVFKLNSKTYTVDGKQLEMDAAPLVAWDRAYLPVRFAANALNVADDQIVWDDKTNTATIFKGDRVITAKVGDKFLTVNGVKVPMEVPVYRDKVKTNNRVMIPIRYLANALNANIEWNKETSEITIQAKK